MPPEESPIKPEHRSFMLTTGRALSRRQSIARVAMVVYSITFLASTLVMCSCPGFYAVMAVCAVVSLIYGTRLQRLFSIALLIVAVAGFFNEVRQERSAKQRAEELRDKLRLHEQK